MCSVLTFVLEIFLFIQIINIMTASCTVSLFGKQNGFSKNFNNCIEETVGPTSRGSLDCVSITPDHLMEKISMNPPVIVDVRESRFYQIGHITGAKSANCYTKTMAKRASTTWKIWFPHRSGETVVIYDQKSDVPCKTAPLMSYINNLLEWGNEVYFLKGGFEAFKWSIPNVDSWIESCLPPETIQQYTCSPTSLDNGSEDVLNATVSEILPFLYLGNERDAHDRDLLNSLEITHILNVSTTVPMYFKESFKYCSLSASDCHAQDLRKFFHTAFKFIDEARSQNKKVFVHCWAGVSRSPTIVLAYLLKNSAHGVLDLLKFLRAKRPVVGPNINFMGQLERFFVDLNDEIEKRSVSLTAELSGELNDISLMQSRSLSSSSGSGDDTPGPYVIISPSQHQFLK